MERATRRRIVSHMNSTADVRIVIADPVSAVRSSLGQLFATTPGWRVAAEAVDAFEAVSAARREHADVLLLSSTISGLTVQEVSDLLAASGTLVVGLLDRPERHAAHAGPSILKSVPWDALQARLHEFLSEHWAARSLRDLVEVAP